MTVFLYSFLFFVSVAVTLGACTLFTNAIEWLGKRFDLSEGAVGGVLAAIGTTLPETSIPIIAIFFGASRAEVEVGLGAILGAPFMLSTLVIPILAILLVVYAGFGKRTAVFKLNYPDVKGDLSFFVVAYTVALACVFIPSRLVHILAAVGLLSLYLYYVKLKFSEVAEEGGEGAELPGVGFPPRLPRPAREFPQPLPHGGGVPPHDLPALPCEAGGRGVFGGGAPSLRGPPVWPGEAGPLPPGRPSPLCRLGRGLPPFFVAGPPEDVDLPLGFLGGFFWRDVPHGD
ncbi:MAG: hypothetical protein Q8S75_12690 [Nitrospirota bacterium]|nr:hypothetical protein [Nitrospirota bacterium]